MNNTTEYHIELQDDTGQTIATAPTEEALGDIVAELYAAAVRTHMTTTNQTARCPSWDDFMLRKTFVRVVRTTMPVDAERFALTASRAAYWAMKKARDERAAEAK